MKSGSFVISAVVLCLFSHSCSINRLTKKGVYREVEPQVYLNYVSDSSINIIDVRTPREYQRSHIQGAVNASYFGGDFGLKVNSLDLDRSKVTLIYCETQHRSLFAARILHRSGFNTIIDLDKGMIQWRKKGYPFESADSVQITP